MPPDNAEESGGEEGGARSLSSFFDMIQAG
jgi:hypothetical protein